LTQNGEIRRQLSGGAVHNTGILTVTGTVLADNGVLKRVRTCPGAFVSCHIGHVTGGEGGGIWNSGQLTLIDSQISDNKAHNGGGISNKGQMWVTDVVFSDNLANDFGGAIHSISLATDVLTRVTVSGNSALYGGGINTFGEFAVRDSNFRNNSAVPGAGLSDGGGLLIQDTGHGTISGTTFHGNTADLGGGLHVYSGGRLHLINSTISGNSASTMGGGIINRYSGNLTLTHVTLTDNFSALAGGGLYAEYHPVVINNSIVAGNRHDGGEGADINGAVNAKFSLVEDSDYVFFLDDGEELIDPAWAGNVTNVRPRLSPLQDNGGLSWTHALMSQSPAIDAAANALSVDDNGDPLDSDQRGLERIADGGSGNIADMGAYELPQSLPPGNDPPSVVDDSYTMEAGATLVVPAADGVLVNDHDPESDFFSAVLERGPQNGQLILAADGSFTYQPQAGFTGVDGFTYVADDGQDRSAEATVTITVAAPNQPPTAVDDEYTVDQDATLTVSAPGLLANDTDADGDALVAIPLTGPAHGTLSFDFDGWFSYTPDPGFSGVDHFTYFAADDESPSNEATVTITVNAVNEAPEAGDDAYEVDQDAALTIAAPGVLSNDTDADGDPLSAVLINGPTNGTLSLDADGAFVYTPDAGFTGNDSFTYVANDGVASSAEATVSITVNAVNEAPVADDDHYRVDQDIPLIVPSAGVLENDTDADGDPLTAVLVSSPTHGTLTLQDDGSFTYVPEPGYFGTDQFTYRASDGIDPSNVAIVSIEVAQVVPPIAPKFLVVDADSTDLFEYDDQGALVGRRSLETDGAAPRGATVIADGSTRWVIDSNHDVSVYDAEGNLLGNWKADGLRRPEGIASDGQHVWIVDRATDRVYRFTDGAGLREGTHAASSDFPLVRGNRNPRGITSDGTRVWIVNDGRNRDAVFQYTTSGMPVGNWTIDDHNASPTGITVDPASASTLWIVDSAAHQIFRYDDAASRVSGSQAADAIFALAGENTNPQGIADPDLESSGTPQPGWSYSPWHNPVNWLDVSDDGVVSPFDMLLILQRLRQAAEGESGAASSIYYDVNNDGLATPLDALLILNRLSSAVPNDDPDDDADGGPEGEAFARAADAIFLDADWLPHAE
jgi:VCBS repeat-containing protein/predicted outer membrane repeat protein